MKLKVFVFEILIPLLLAVLLGLLFKSVYCSGNQINYFLAWVLIGFPFGLRYMVIAFRPSRRSLSGAVGLFALQVIVSGLIGGLAFIFGIARGILRLVMPQ